jgi:hypothetical protein
VRKGYSPATPTVPDDFREVPDENFKKLLKAIEDCPAPVNELSDKAQLELLKTELATSKSENADLRLRLNNVELLYSRELKKSSNQTASQN